MKKRTIELYEFEDKDIYMIKDVIMRGIPNDPCQRVCCSTLRGCCAGCDEKGKQEKIINSYKASGMYELLTEINNYVSNYKYIINLKQRIKDTVNSMETQLKDFKLIFQDPKYSDVLTMLVTKKFEFEDKK